jgi:hypothetical protein
LVARLNFILNLFSKMGAQWSSKMVEKFLEIARKSDKKYY